jgi:hypothetical protein
MPVGLPATVVLDHVLPGSQEPRCVPVPIRECGPGAPHSRRGETKVSEARDNGTTALEQATAEQHPEEMEEPQIGANGYVRDHPRQNAVDTGEYGGHQVSSLQYEVG